MSKIKVSAIHDPDNDNLAIGISTAGNVGIGTASPSSQLHLSAGTPTIRLTDSDNNADAYIQGTDGNLRFFADDSQEASNSIVTFAVDGTERMRILSSGGITFNGDTATANALDDYEEGGWTPAALVNLSYSTASYQKIGNTVTINAFITVASNSDGNTFKITGMPFAINSSSSSVGCFNNTGSDLYAYMDGNGIYIRDYYNSSKTCGNLSTKFIAFQLQYTTNS